MLLIRNTPEFLSGAPEYFLGFNYTTRLGVGGSLWTFYFQPYPRSSPYSPDSCSPMSPFITAPATTLTPSPLHATGSPGFSAAAGSLRRRASPPSPLCGEGLRATLRAVGPSGLTGGTDQAELGARPVHPERDVVAELRQRSAALGHGGHGRQEPAEQRRGRAGRPQPAAPHAGRRLRRGRAASRRRHVGFRQPRSTTGAAPPRAAASGAALPPQVRGRARTERAKDRGVGGSE